MRAVASRFDPLAATLALLTGGALFALQEGPVLALLCAASVLVVGVLAPAIAERATPAARSDRWYAPLTRREADVALLIAEGLSNKQIAERLGIGERGVESHVFNIMNRLSFHNRTQIAVWIREKQRRSAKESPPKKSVPT